LIAPLRALGEPLMDGFTQMPTAGLSHIHMDPENPVPGLGDGMTLKELPDEAIDAWVSVAGIDSGSPLLLSEFRHVGGALGRPDPGGGPPEPPGPEVGIERGGGGMGPGMGGAALDPPNPPRGDDGPVGAEGAYYNFSDRPKHVDHILP